MITFQNNSITAGNAGYNLLIEGASQGTVVKSLELITGNASCTVSIVRTGTIEQANPTDNQIEAASYATIPVQMKANDYLVLWEGFFVIPAGHRLYFNVTPLGAGATCTAVVNYVAMSDNS